MTAPTDAAHFLAALHAAGERACEATPVTRSFCIAGLVLRLHFADATLAALLTPALAHLALPEQTHADLEVMLWDGVRSGIAAPTPPWQATAYGPRGEIQGYNTDELRIAFNADAGTLSVFHAAEQCGYWWVRDAAQLPLYERGAPLLVLLHWWLATHDRQLVHGGATGLPTGGVLLVGRGGSGKSTSVLACLGSALRMAGDDYCVVRATPVPTVHSLYCSAKLNADSLAWLPHLADIVDNPLRPSGKKALLLLGERPALLITEMPLRAIVLPRIGTMTQLRPASPGAALRALAPSTIFQLAGAGEAAMRTLASLVRQIPAYELELGRDLARIPTVLSTLTT